MEIVEIIRHADSSREVLAALSMYLESLRDASTIPEWCLRPIEGEADLGQRMLAMFTVINLSSQNLRYRDCNAAKRALQALSAAAARLRRTR
jgi:hypothetical protein